MKRILIICITFLVAFFTSPANLKAQTDLSEGWEINTMKNQPPKRIMDSIGVKPGMVIGEVGAGRGRFTVYLSREVGPQGIIYANDIVADALEQINKKCKSDNITNIKTVLGVEDDPLLPEKNLDMVVVFDCLFEFKKPAEWMKNTMKYLKPDGKLIIVDPDSSKLKHSQFLSRKKVEDFARKAGYSVVKVKDSFLKNLMIIALKPKQFNKGEKP